jgi:hypothetical protein
MERYRVDFLVGIFEKYASAKNFIISSLTTDRHAEMRENTQYMRIAAYVLHKQFLEYRLIFHILTVE